MNRVEDCLAVQNGTFVHASDRCRCERVERDADFARIARRRELAERVTNNQPLHQWSEGAEAANRSPWTAFRLKVILDALGLLAGGRQRGKKP